MAGRGLTEDRARDLLEAGAVRSAAIEPAGDRWAVVLRVGMEDRPIASRREDVRLWSSLDTLVRWLRRLGLRDASIRVQ